MTLHDTQLFLTGTWGENIAWELFESTTPPPAELCTAVMCVAIANGRIVLARSQRGWGLLGGHIEDGETLEDALHREALEEGGFIINKHQQFAVRKITSKEKIPHQQPDKHYPFPESYIVYYWATSSQMLKAPTGAEIIERNDFALRDVQLLDIPDWPVLKTGWRAALAKQADRA